MASDSGNSFSLLGIHCLYVYTNVNTNFVLFIHEDDNVFKVKENICREYMDMYSGFGDVRISALKMKKRGCFFNLSNSLVMRKIFSGLKDDWFITAVVEKVEKSAEQLALIVADKNNPNIVLTEKNKNTDQLAPNEVKPLEAATAVNVENTKTKKRKTKTADANNASSEKVAKRRRRRSRVASTADQNGEQPALETNEAVVEDSNNLGLKRKVVKKTSRRTKKSVSHPTIIAPKETAVVAGAEASLKPNQTDFVVEKGVVLDTVDSTGNQNVAAAVALPDAEQSVENDAAKEKLGEGVASDTVGSSNNPPVTVVAATASA